MPSYKAGASEDRPEQVLFQVHLFAWERAALRAR